MLDFDGEVIVGRTRFASDDMAWGVVEGTAADGDDVVLVGPVAHLEPRERARIVGTWVEDRRYGMQVRVTEAHPLAPTDPATLAAYLKRVRHVGARRATRLIDRFGAPDVIAAIDRDPRAAFTAVGLSGARAREAATAWDELRVTRQLHMLLAPYGLTYLVGRIHERLGPKAHRVVSARPYELTSVFGVGFAIADRIARGAGGPADPAGRARAAAVHALGEAERSGSTCLPEGELLAACRALLGEPLPDGALAAMVDDEALVRRGGWLYRPLTARLEGELAERTVRLACAEPVEDLTRPDDDAPGGGEAELTGEQRAAVLAAFAHRLSVITGGPGTGKTATIRAIARRALQRGARVMLVAPTGRAAVRMREASGIEARTVHSALGWVPGEGPSHDEDDPLPCELLIVDESSMANQELMVTLLRAVGERTHVVLVGDADQLAPVGAGKPFAELVAADLVPTARLTHIFRQAAGSMIVQGAHAIRRGEAPSFRSGPEMRRDLFLLERADPVAARAEIVSLVTERLPAHYGVDPVAGIQVFAPVYRGELGIDALNAALREALNPGGRRLRGDRLRIGDKLMMTGRNLHELGLMNGTLLRLLDEVTAAEDDDPALLLTGDEGTVFRLPAEEAEGLRLAYACSVHRGQGIELPIAVIVAHPAAGAFFLRREMLYTAITRSTIATVIVGSRQVVERAARTADTGARHGRLAERMLECLA